MQYNNLLVNTQDGICSIAINRPNQLNALNMETIDELNQCLSHVNEDEKVGVVILTGSGEKAFVAGADIKEFADFSVEEGKDLSAQGHQKLFDFVENMSKPVIAAVNGFALGGGLELAMSSHIRIASSNAKMGLPEVSLGVIPGYGGTQRLAQLVGKGMAFQMITSAEMIDAEKAQSIGLVNQVVEQSELIATCEKLASRIMRNSPQAIRSAIVAVNAGFVAGTNGYQAEVDEFGKCFGTSDFKEGTQAFIEKRKPSFKR